MTSFQVFQDIENQQVNPKLKDSKTAGIQRSALGRIDPNTAQSFKQPPQKSKLAVYEDKDVSKALEEVRLETKHEVKQKEERKPLAVIEQPKVDDEILESPTSDADSTFSMSINEVDTTLACREALNELYDCLEYRDDIYNYLRQLESRIRAKPYYMKRQPDITYSMRTILVDWLVEVADEYKLHNETLFLAVSYIDRFLSSMAVVRAKLQLLGAAAMFLASKYEEIYPPDVGEFSYITDDTYSKKQVLRMEHLLLKTLSFDLSSPTIHTFLTHMSIVGKLDECETILAMFIGELTLLEGDPYLQFSPSLIAAGCIALARHILLLPDVWPSSLAKITSYSTSHLAKIMPHLNSTHSKADKIQQKAILEKYKSKKFKSVSCLAHRSLILRSES